MKKRLAVIGASTGQLPLCQKAHKMGLETFCFAWPKGAICKDYVDHFIPVSIFEMDEIVRYCREYGIDGIVSNASETTALVVSYVAEKLGKVCTPYESFIKIQNKEFVRRTTNALPLLSKVDYNIGLLDDVVSSTQPPYVLKPIKGAAKKGVNFVSGSTANLLISDDLKDAVFIAEKYITGKEYSVESMSYNHQHEVIQITEKVGTGAPHFVELEHHQPAVLAIQVEDKIRKVIPLILSSIGFTNGASHTEIKVDEEDNIFLIEVNPRGGGDYISNNLIGLSTDYDYLKQLILVSLGMYEPVPAHNIAYSGIYFLSAYTEHLLPYFEEEMKEWMVIRERTGKGLTHSCSNYDRDGFILYCSNKKIIL